MKIPVAEPSIGADDIAAVSQTVASGWISSIGENIPRFEEGFARYCGVKYGIATSNGTAALHLALAALGIGPGDEVIVPTLTFVASANAIKYTGAEPVFIDSHPDYWCLNPDMIEPLVTSRAKAIMPVHLYGHPCDMAPVVEIAQRHGLFLIEDAAEAHGAMYQGRRVGSFGDIACFSFYANKVITTGEGGMCLTDDQSLAERMKQLRDHAMSPQQRYWHEMIGFNYRMTNLQAALGVSQLAKIDTFLSKKREIAGWYAKALAELEERELITLPAEMGWARNIYWMYTILLTESGKMKRDQLMTHLNSNGIETRPMFYPLHLMPMYLNKQTYSVAENLARRGVTLPSSANLTAEQVEYICQSIKERVLS